MSEEMKDHTYSGEYRSGIARAKKILLAAGYIWSKKTGRYSPFDNGQKVSRGVTVTRIGCSGTIALHVHFPSYLDREHRRFVEMSVIEALRAAGMPFDDRGWLDCRNAY